MRFLILCFVLVGSYAAPVNEPLATKKIDKGLTVEEFDGYVNLLKMFREMLPKDLMSTLENLNITQKGEVVDFLSAWFQDRIIKPNSTFEIVDLLKQHVPSVYDRIQSLNASFYTKFDALKPESQNLLREWRDKAVDLVGDRPAGESAAKNLQLLRDFATSIRDVNPDIRNDLRTQFPSAVSLTEGLGFTVFTTLIMVVQKIVEAATALPLASPTVVASVECALPLD